MTNYNRIDHTPGVWTIKNFMSTEECKRWIEFSENRNYETATIGVGRVQKHNLQVRNNDRVIYDDQDLANDLYERAKPNLLDRFGNLTVHGLNSRFRFYKYSSGQQFKAHQDGSYIKDATTWSEFTFMVYLNDDYNGGQTKFLKTTVEPEAGLALVFKHQLVHEGCPVTSGVKYVLRSDVMYQFHDEE